MKLYALVFSLCSAFASVAAAQERVPIQSDSFRLSLDDLERRGDLVMLFRAANSPQNREQLGAGLNWLQSRALHGDVRDPRYLLVYANLLNMANVTDTAVGTYLAGMLLAQVEAARCKEQSGARATIEQLQRQWQFFENRYWGLPTGKRKQTLEFAFGIEKVKSLGKGGPVSWLCPGGVKEMGIALQKAMAGEARVTVAEEPGRPRQINVDTSGIAPEFLAEHEFSARRLTVLDEFKSRYSKAETHQSNVGTPQGKTSASEKFLVFCPLSAGDSLDKVKEYYNIDEDPRLEGTVFPGASPAYSYHFPNYGVWIFLDSAKRVKNLRFESPFVGEIEGVSPGDSLEKLLSLKGEPISRFSGMPDTTTPTGDSRHLARPLMEARIYRSSERKFLRYDVSPLSRKVGVIFSDKGTTGPIEAAK